MMNTRKPASPFGMAQPAQAQRPAQASGQYGANASPGGNAYGQRFMQQYGSPPGQMRDQFAAFRQQGGMGGMGGQPSQPMPGAPPQMPQMGQNPMQSWMAQRPQFGGGQPNDPRAMMMAWLAQRPRGLLGG